MKQVNGTTGVQLLLASVIIGHLALYAVMWSGLLNRPALGGIDFISFYTAGRIAQSAGCSRLYDLELQRSVQREILAADSVPDAMLPFMHPPFLVPLLQHTAGDDFTGSYIRWSFLLLLAASLCFVLLFRFFRHGNRLSLPSAILTSAACVLFFPNFISLLKGQDTLFMLLGALLWMGALNRRNDGLAGASLVLVALKPHIALLLAVPTLLARRRSRLPFCITAAAAALFSLLLVGAQGLRDYIRLMGITAQGEGYGVNQDKMYNFIGLALRAVPQVDPAMVRMLGWGVFLVTLAFLCLRYFGRKELRTYDIGLVVLLALFTSPHLHFHDLSLLTLPLAGIAAAFAGKRSRRCAVAAALPLAVSSVLLFVTLIPGSYGYPSVYLIMLLLGIGLRISNGSAPKADPAIP